MLEYYLKTLKLPLFLRKHQEVANECHNQGKDYKEFLLKLSEMEVFGRQDKAIQVRLKKARFPILKTLDSFNFDLIPTLNKRTIVNLAAGDYMEKHENIIALGNSGTGKTHIAIALGMAACQKGSSVYYTTASNLVHELLESLEEKKFMGLQKKISNYALLIIDELGFVPFSKAGAELLFEIISSRYEKGSIIITSNLPFEEWTSVFGCERLTGALLDRLTHHVHILEMNGDSYRLHQSKAAKSNKKDGI